MLIDCHMQRSELLGKVQKYQEDRSGPAGRDRLLDEHVQVMVAGFGCTEAEAADRCKVLFAPSAHGDSIRGVRKNMCPSIFSYSKTSMWRGTPSNPLIGKLARSIISSGFRSSSVIESRTLELAASESMPDMVSFLLLLGDGSARATAACIVWMLLVKFVDSMPCNEPNIVSLITSLLDISVNFELHGDGSSTQALVAQAALQNQAAAVQPCSTLQWIGMARDFMGMPIGDHVGTSSQLQRTLEDMVSSYNARPEVEAYVEEAMPSRKKRRGKLGQAAVEDEGRDQGLKIGRKRLMAMKNFLAGASEEGLATLERHICVMGDYKFSVVTDDIFLQKSIFINSKLPKEWLPSDADLAIREAVSEATLKLIAPGAARSEFIINPPLTPAQFLMMLEKLIHVYESAVEGIESDEGKFKQRPTEEDWLRARVIVQLWDLTIREVALKDLGKDDFNLFQKLVLESDQLTKELCAIRSRWGKWFHMGLLPQLVSDDAPSVDDTIRSLSTAQGEAESSNLKVFQLEIAHDWLVIEKMEHGYQALRELQAWRANQHRRAQAKLGEVAVSAWRDLFFPFCEVASWDRVPPQVSLICRSWPKVVGLQRAVMILDFNAPGARDSLRMSSMIQAAASCCKILGPDDSIVLAWMPNCSKEGSESTAFEDEVIIVNTMKAAGFKNHDRIRMLLDMPPSLATKVRSMDWFADGRLCWLETENENFWAANSELARTKTVREVPILPEPAELLEVTSLDANEDLNTSTRYMDVPEKCAQRGVHVSVVQIAALLARTKRQTPSKWLCKDDQVVLVDFHPHVGDRAMATHELSKSSDGALGRLHHIMVGVGVGHHSKFMKFAGERISHHAASQWLDGTLKLRSMVMLPNGLQVEEELKPQTDPPEPTEDELRLTPGALDAYRGMGKLEFKVCSLSGSKIIIRTDKLKQFGTAGFETITALAELQTKHTARYESAFRSMDTGKKGPVSKKGDTDESDVRILADSRSDSKATEQAPDGDECAQNLVEFESMEALKAHAAISAECKSAAKGVMLLLDDRKKTVYVVAKAEDIILSKGTMLGGIGGGHILDSDDTKTKAVPWTLPEGDKTWIQLAKTKGEDDGDDKSRFVSGTLYSIIRELESKSTKPLKLTSFGQVVATSEAGLQKYNFSSPEGAENHRRLDYVPSPGKPGGKATYANLFATLVTRHDGLGEGVLRLTWRLQHDHVGHCLKPRAVHVTTSSRIMLAKGKPVKIGWPTADKAE